MSARRFISRNPFNGKVLRQYDFASDTEVNQKINTAHEAFKNYRKTDFKHRSGLLRSLAASTEKHLDKLAQSTSEEMGKPITQSIADVKKSINHCNHFADRLEDYLRPSIVQTEARKSGVFYDPLGIVYLIVPFNFPVWLVYKSAVPILAAGNTVIFRNSDSTPYTAEIIEDVFKEAGFGQGELLNVFSTREQLELLCSNDKVRGVSFTGSTAAGSHIAQVASKHIKKTVMELGGCDPCIVLKDADLELASLTAVKSRLSNCGQVCISLKRVIVQEEVYDEFVDKVIKKFKSYKLGDPLQKTTDIGPLAREDLREQVQSQLDRGVKEGAKVLFQHDKWTGNKEGFFFSPAIVEATTSNTLASEEVFGPVMTLLKAKSEAHAIELANETQYGLGSALFTRDLQRAEQLIHQIDAGAVFVNEIMKSDSRLPSGGTKKSGFGRECGEQGAREFTNLKTFWIN